MQGTKYMTAARAPKVKKETGSNWDRGYHPAAPKSCMFQLLASSEGYNLWPDNYVGTKDTHPVVCPLSKS